MLREVFWAVVAFSLYLGRLWKDYRRLPRTFQDENVKSDNAVGGYEHGRTSTKANSKADLTRFGIFRVIRVVKVNRAMRKGRVSKDKPRRCRRAH